MGAIVAGYAADPTALGTRLIGKRLWLGLNSAVRWLNDSALCLLSADRDSNSTPPLNRS